MSASYIWSDINEQIYFDIIKKLTFLSSIESISIINTNGNHKPMITGVGLLFVLRVILFLQEVYAFALRNAANAGTQVTEIIKKILWKDLNTVLHGYEETCCTNGQNL